MILDLPFEPAVLAQRCREYIEQLGYHEPAHDSVSGFAYGIDYQQYLIQRDDGVIERFLNGHAATHGSRIRTFSDDPSGVGLKARLIQQEC